MDGETDGLDPGEVCRKTIGGSRLVQLYAEFILLSTGRDFDVGLCVDIGVDPDPDPRPPTACAGDLAETA